MRSRSAPRPFWRLDRPKSWVPVQTFVPCRTVVSSNAREHWSQKASRTRKERDVTAWALVRFSPVTLPCTVRLVRRGPNALDKDNLQTACKAIRDEVAAWLGIDDRDERVTWDYGQEPTRRRTKTTPAEVVGVRIEVTPGA